MGSSADGSILLQKLARTRRWA